MSSIVDFRNEAELQEVIASQPELLNPCFKHNDDSCGWILIAREFMFPSGLTSSWAKPLDVLFLDSNGTPTLVETKLGYDNTTRREVIGQMIDYLSAANLQDSSQNIKSALEERCQRSGINPEDAIQSAFDGQLSSTTLWTRLRAAVASQQFRLVFVFDRVPGELARAAHSLDILMPTVAVQALEVIKYHTPERILYESKLVGIERWQAPLERSRRPRTSKEVWEPISIVERKAASIRIEERTRLLPLPEVFRLEANNSYGKANQHQVDPSRPEGNIAVMPNLDLLESTKNPYPAKLPHPTVKCKGESYLDWVHIAYVVWEYIVSNGEVIHPRDAKKILDAAAVREPNLLENKKFIAHGSQGVLDALRDLQLYGLCRAFRRGGAWRFVRDD